MTAMFALALLQAGLSTAAAILIAGFVARRRHSICERGSRQDREKRGSMTASACGS